jgi:hypothetical protein
MTGMMRSRVSGCLCRDCSGGWHKDRVQEKREWEKQVHDDLPDDDAGVRR